MTTEMYNNCLLCNPEANWLEVEFRSELNEPIEGLKVTITNPSTQQIHQTYASKGRAIFENIVAGEWVVSVETENLLSTVEQYASRKGRDDSPVKEWANGTLDRDQSAKAYYVISVGDLWDTLPEDDFLIGNYGPLRTNYREDAKGFRTCHNRACILEIRSLRCYLPMIVDTDEFSLVNSYTFALLSQLAYASDKFGIPDSKNPSLPEGGIDELVKQLKLKTVPLYCASTKEDWLVSEAPYSQHLSADYYQDGETGAEGYILSNDDIAIIGVRGTQTYFGNEEISKLGQNNTIKIIDKVSQVPVLKIAEVSDGVMAFLNSPGYKDVATDLNASQIAPEEFGGKAYVHQGFYMYMMALLFEMDKDIELHINKAIYVCGHSLGGAGALLLSALIKDAHSMTTLRLFTYGMPRAGTHNFVRRYSELQHYRHVNNHDLVPQLPMRWMNTNPDEKSDDSSLWKYIYTPLYVWDSLKDRTMDSDDDNYQHHGSLIQLLTYSLIKHQSSDVKQVLLTEKQAHISSLTLASNKSDDSYRLADSLRKDYLDINGYVNTITHSGMDHLLSEYIPNFKHQIMLLLSEHTKNNYADSLKALVQTEEILLNTYQQLKMDEVNVLGQQHFSRKDPRPQAQIATELSRKRFKIRQELKLTEKIILNLQRVKKGLEALIETPELLPPDNLLFGDKKQDRQIVKEQLL